MRSSPRGLSQHRREILNVIRADSGVSRLWTGTWRSGRWEELWLRQNTRLPCGLATGQRPWGECTASESRQGGMGLEPAWSLS